MPTSVETTASVSIAPNLTAVVGNTPLYRLTTLTDGLDDVEILVKAEWMNPSGSVKDRAASNIVRTAERNGTLKPSQTLLDASSGNFGTSLAMVGASRGYKVTVCVPSNVPEERKRMLKAFGAETVLTDGSRGSDGATIAARELAASNPALYFYTDQYSNPANWQAHYLGTAEEIWQQSQGRVTHFVASVGSSGTFMGTSRRLRELNASIQCIAMQPDCSGHHLRGMKHMETAMRPAIYEESAADRILRANTADAVAAARRLSREEGMLVGVTSGAALLGCLEIARTCLRPATIVAIFPDTGMNCIEQLYA